MTLSAKAAEIARVICFSLFWKADKTAAVIAS